MPNIAPRGPLLGEEPQLPVRAGQQDVVLLLKPPEHKLNEHRPELYCYGGFLSHESKGVSMAVNLVDNGRLPLCAALLKRSHPHLEGYLHPPPVRGRLPGIQRAVRGAAGLDPQQLRGAPHGNHGMHHRPRAAQSHHGGAWGHGRPLLGGPLEARAHKQRCTAQRRLLLLAWSSGNSRAGSRRCRLLAQKLLVGLWVLRQLIHELPQPGCVAHHLVLAHALKARDPL
mmetsp:Transcript_29418/g.82962  ORF Transcript_29418/g.82962 Transcript_29418/m.82962 type:complete len:227 (-) Transcript_29418:11-691(-)